ncbi:hypothetical protein I4F81_008069 [Pyropia yezoensis]|uniref:Uncharacterized protein n=1 Tax=Pyropia yezoensis TaxID=2788 RepID=A0ACC3C6E7_PYRYE|nr:hypothetical protein I4F81_008069 [Neopyropia yezoensis]
MGRPSASRWGQLSIWTDWAASPSCVRQGVDTAVRAVACDQFFNGNANHRDWAAQACVYYDSAARMMKLAEGVETDKEIKAELTSGAAECVRRAKELRDSLAKPAGCGCPACKAAGPPKKEEPKKEQPKKEAAAKHCHCVVCLPAAKTAGCTCPKCKPAGKCLVHPGKVEPNSIRSVPAAEEGAPASPQAVDAIVAASLPWYAVYERLGVPSVAAELEADAARRRVADVAAQLEAWTDGGDAWRTETDVGRPDIPGLFEELVHDTF